MKITRFPKTQIISILKELETGKELKDICREYCIARGTLYKWKKKYAGIDAVQLKSLRSYTMKTSV